MVEDVSTRGDFDQYSPIQYIYITARLGGQYGGIFSSRLAVLARAQRGTIQKPRNEYSPVLPGPKECSNRFIV